MRGFLGENKPMNLKKLAMMAHAAHMMSALEQREMKPTFEELKSSARNKQSRRDKKALHKTKRGGHTYIFG